jgi:hypothetical protein
MKAEILEQLESFHTDLRDLKKKVSAQQGDRITKGDIRATADELATRWVESLRSPLEYKFRIASDTVTAYSEDMKRLHVLSRPNNRKSSYLATLNSALKSFDDRLVLPIKQASFAVEGKFDLAGLVPTLSDEAESEYLKEALDAANSGFHRAAIVLGWCAAIDRIQRKILAVGLVAFNQASKAIKAQTSGKFKRWNKEFSITTLSELQTVFDTDLVVVLEGMQLIDGNQADRLEVCFQYRNHSAHPGQAPIGQPHLVAFFTDIAAIVLANPMLKI